MDGDQQADPVVGAAGVVELMERHDVVALRALLPEGHWGWLDAYLSTDSGWRLIEILAGSDRAIVATRALSKTMARVVIQGDRGQGFVTVSFGDHGELRGFALYSEEFEGIGSIVLACPRDRRRDMATFYDSLLGTDPRRRPQLGFGGGETDPPPRWPDPDAPPQMHLDLLVADIERTERAVTAGGATLLMNSGDHRTYADPVGHPFCLYPDPSPAEDGHAPAREQAVLWRIVVDCFSPRSLAGFYERLLGLSERVEDSPKRVVIGSADGRLPLLAFQHVPAYSAPRWPDRRYPQQVHLDLKFDDRPAAEALALTLGAMPLPAQGGSCPVYADPAGHPLCFCYPGE